MEKNCFQYLVLIVIMVFFFQVKSISQDCTELDGFENQETGQMSLLGTDPSNPWAIGYGNPQIVDNGCDDPKSIILDLRNYSGNSDAPLYYRLNGDPVFIAGVTYNIEFKTNVFFSPNSVNPDIQMKAIDNIPTGFDCNGVCEVIYSSTLDPVAGCETHQITWTPSIDYKYAVFDGDTKWDGKYAQILIDNICIPEKSVECDASFEIISSSECGEICIENTSSGNSLQYSWEVYDDANNLIQTINNVKDPCILLPNNEIYNIILIITNDNGCTDEQSIQYENIIINMSVSCLFDQINLPGDPNNNCLYKYKVPAPIVNNATSIINTTVTVNGSPSNVGSIELLGIGTNIINYVVNDECGEVSCSFKLEVICEQTLPEQCGWMVATCLGKDPSADVGVLFDTRFNSNSPNGGDWNNPTLAANQISSIHPAMWKVNTIGQVFGIAIDNNSGNIYLGATNEYEPFQSPISGIAGTAGIYITAFTSPNITNSLVTTVNTGSPNTVGTTTILNSGISNLSGSNYEMIGNGIGNLAYDNTNNQLFATNLEDGRIFRINASTGIILSIFDPFVLDNGLPGVVDFSELIYGIGVLTENGSTSVYFARSLVGGGKEIWSIKLDNSGEFVATNTGGNLFDDSASSSIIEIPYVPGTQNRITDIAFSSKGNILLAERGDPHQSKTYEYYKTGGNWVLGNYYYTGGGSGKNTAGGVDYGEKESNGIINSQCDAFVWSSTNYAVTQNEGCCIYGIQGMDSNGNSSVNAVRNSTDKYIDLNSTYSLSDKFGIGDVELFHCGCETPEVTCDSLMVMVSPKTSLCYDPSIITGNPCLSVYFPVCGCDGNTYSNECYAKESGITTYVSGECNGENTPEIDTGCCYTFDIKNNWGNDIVGVDFEILGNEWIFNKINLNSIFSFGSCNPLNNYFCIQENNNGSIPSGITQDAISVCFAKTVQNPLNNPQVVYHWKLKQNNTDTFIVCSDTLDFDCLEPPIDSCFEITESTINCSQDNNPLHYDYCFRIKNNSGVAVGQIVLEDITNNFAFLPLGTLSKIILPLPNPLPDGATSQLICVGIKTVNPILNTDILCLKMGLISEDGKDCCHSPIETCIEIEPCCNPCEENGIKANKIDGDEGECCYSIDLLNNCKYKYFTKLNVHITTGGVNFGSHVLGVPHIGNWTIASTPTSISFTPVGGYMTQSTYNDLFSFCLDNIDDPSKDYPEIVFDWYTSISGEPRIACSDTLTTDCISPDSNVCVVVTDQNLVCIPDSNKYRYTFTITNKSNPSFIADKLHLNVTNDPSNYAPYPTGPVIPLNPPLNPNETRTISTCIKGVPFPPSYSDFIFGYRLQGNQDCCFESVLDTIPIPPCDDCCDEQSLSIQLDDFFKTITVNGCEVCFDPTELDSCIGLSIKWGDGSGNSYPLDKKICKSYSNSGFFIICIKFEVYSDDEDFPCFLKEKCFDLEKIVCDSSDCCESEEKFKNLISQGFDVNYLDNCTVEVCANQFDTCHWFWTLGPDWGDGSSILPALQHSNPPNNCWTHTYASSGNYTISINVEEASNGEMCWSSKMETEVEVSCESKPCFDILESVLTDVNCDTSNCNVNPWCHDWFRDFVAEKQANCTGGFIYKFEKAMWGSTPVIVMSGSGPPDYSQYIIFDCNGTTIQDCSANGGGGYPCSPDAGINYLTDLTNRTIIWNCNDPIPPIDPNCGNGYTSIKYDVTIKNTGSHTIDLVCINPISPLGIIVSPTMINVNLLPSNTTTINVDVLGSLTAGDIVKIEIVLKDTLDNGEIWKCSDTISIIVPECPCPDVDNICDLVSANAKKISTGTDECCYEIEIANDYCENYFTGIKIDLSSPASISQINTNSNWIITQITNLVAVVKPKVGYIPIGKTTPFTICNTSITDYNITISWLVPSNGGIDEVCPANLQLEHCSVDPPFSCYEFVKDTIDCENNTYCFKIKNTSNPGFDLYSVSIYDLTGGLVLSPTGLINIPNAPLAYGQTSDWICVQYSGVNPSDKVCYKLVAHNNPPNTPPTRCCTDTLENCFEIPNCDNQCGICPDESIAGPNLIENGDFSALYTGGWYSNYNLNMSGLTGTNEYSVRNSTNLINTQWAALDHTNGSPVGNFLTINGPSLNTAYGVSVNVKANTNYVFCIWVDNLVNTTTPSDPVIKVDINGNTVVSGVALPKTPDGWQLITYNYNSGSSSGPIVIEVFDIGNTNYNDWAIDDVSFRECIKDDSDCCSISDSIFQSMLDSVNIINNFDTCHLCVNYNIDSCTQMTLEFDGGGTYTLTGEGIQCQSYGTSTSGIVKATIIRVDGNGDTCKIATKEMFFDLNCIVDVNDCCENTEEDLLSYIEEIFDDKAIDSCEICFPMDLDSCDYYTIYFDSVDSISGNGNDTICHSYLKNGNYNITIKIINYDTLGNICTQADSTINIDIFDCTPDSGCDINTIKIYNALSPGNGDILNDKLIIEDYLDCGRVDLSIYNRWGQLVWEQSNYDNSWNGIGLQGKPLPDGTYFLILGLPDQKDKTKRLKTFIDLRRDK